MIPGELIRKVRQIEIRTRRAVNDALAGEYTSVFKGHGIEFEEVREYAPGDDVRSIDWNVTARSGTPFIKRYREERQLTVLFLVDLSASGEFGSLKRTKTEVGAELCAMIAFSAIHSDDRVGLIEFTDSVELFIPPMKGQRHVLRIVRELLAAEPRGRGTNLNVALEYLLRVVTKRAVVFIISDFLTGGYEKTLAVAARKHDVNAVRITDSREGELPDVGLILLEDAESGEVKLVDTSSRIVRRKWHDESIERRAALQETCRRLSVEYVEVSTSGDYLGAMLGFFSRRNHKRGTRR